MACDMHLARYTSHGNATAQAVANSSSAWLASFSATPRPSKIELSASARSDSGLVLQNLLILPAGGLQVTMADRC